MKKEKLQQLPVRDSQNLRPQQNVLLEALVDTIMKSPIFHDKKFTKTICNADKKIMNSFSDVLIDDLNKILEDTKLDENLMDSVFNFIEVPDFYLFHIIVPKNDTCIHVHNNNDHELSIFDKSSTQKEKDELYIKLPDVISTTDLDFRVSANLSLDGQSNNINITFHCVDEIYDDIYYYYNLLNYNDNPSNR